MLNIIRTYAYTVAAGIYIGLTTTDMWLGIAALCVLVILVEWRADVIRK